MVRNESMLYSDRWFYRGPEWDKHRREMEKLDKLRQRGKL